ncbi:terminase small subunit [Marinobacterium jannaschii]|uniref:terminase small subunit n=1 Tax=Marinobacterium jannaschii TaxID=64970 RepID=UPI00048032F2|nr:terminase small subunit [Marinobacterium jannaschii]
MGITVSKKTLADMIGKSPRWVTKLIEDGLPVRGGGGRGKAVELDTEEVINWLIRQEVMRRFGDGEEIEEGSTADEDRQLKRVRREKIELEIDRERGKVLPLDAVEPILFRIATVLGTQIDALASRNASELAVINDPAEIRQVLFSEGRRIRAVTSDRLLSEVRALAEEIDGILAADGGDGEGSASEDG